MTIRRFSPNENYRDTDETLRWALIIRKTFRQQALTIGIISTAIPASPLSSRINILIVNNSNSGQILYLGDSTVTTANGVPLYPRQSLLTVIEDGVNIYGVSSAAGADIRIWEGS